MQTKCFITANRLTAAIIEMKRAQEIECIEIKCLQRDIHRISVDSVSPSLVVILCIFVT